MMTGRSVRMASWISGYRSSSTRKSRMAGFSSTATTRPCSSTAAARPTEHGAYTTPWTPPRSSHREDQQIGRVLVGPVRAGRRIRRLGDLESAAHQEALQAVGSGGWVADEEDAKLRLLGQPISRTFGGVSSYSSRYGTATAERGT